MLWTSAACWSWRADEPAPAPPGRPGNQLDFDDRCHARAVDLFHGVHHVQSGRTLQDSAASGEPDTGAAGISRALGDHRHGRRQLPGQRAHPDQCESRHVADCAGQGSRFRPRSHHDSRRCAHHAPRRGNRDGCCGQTRIRPAQYRDLPFGSRSLSAASAAGSTAAGDSWASYRRLLKYAKPHAGVFLIGVMGSILFATSNAALAYLVKKFLNGAFLVKNPAVLWEVPLGVVVLFTLRGIGDYVQSYYPSWVGRQVIKGLRHDVFAHYLRLPTAYLDSQQSGHMLSKLTNNIELVAAAATSAAISLISDSLNILGLLIWLFYKNWRLATFCIVAAPVIGWLMKIANRSFRRYSERIQNSMGDITRVAKEAIDAHR